MLKQCKQCKKTKTHKDFYKHPSTKDNLFSKCKKCHNENSIKNEKKHQERQRIKPEEEEKENEEKVSEIIKETIINSDKLSKNSFILMPHSAQILYIHLTIRANNDRIVFNPKAIQKLIRASEEDMKLLYENKLIKFLEDGGDGMIFIKK